ncbi:MAG: conjugative transposon protein TraM [Rikenellaceae bacterium]
MILEKIFKRKFSAEERRKFTLVGISSLLVSVVLIAGFGLSSKGGKETQQTAQGAGFNTDMPEPAKDQINGDKTTTTTSKRGRSEEDMEVIKNMEEMMKAQTEAVQQSIKTSAKTESAKEIIQASTETYKNVNRTLSNFYDRPQVDQEKKQMEEEIEELKLQIKMQSQQAQPMGVDEQMAIIEKSYEMAAKYNPDGSGSSIRKSSDSDEDDKPAPQTAQKAGGSLVSSLSAQSTRGFNTAVATATKEENNTFEACIHNDKTIRNGEKVQLRLLETMIIGETEIPKGSVITGIGAISGERLNINITQLEVGGMIIPTELRVIDTDGINGIHIPATKEVGALKEIVANMSGSMGTTVNLTSQSAGDQILTDLGTSAIDGVSQYVADKIREVKVHLKSGYRVLLY